MLPGCASFVYELWSRALCQVDVLLYVGVSDDPFGRFREHQRTAEWFHNVDRVEINSFPDRVAAERFEECLIRAAQPLFNRERYGGEPWGGSTQSGFLTTRGPLLKRLRTELESRPLPGFDRRSPLPSPPTPEEMLQFLDHEMGRRWLVDNVAALERQTLDAPILSSDESETGAPPVGSPSCEAAPT